MIAEAEDDVYLVVGHSNATLNGCYKENYVIDATSGIIREARYALPEVGKNASFNHMFNLGNYLVLHSEECVGQESESSNVYYTDSKAETIVERHTWKASTKSHFFVPSYDPNELIEAVHSNGEVDSVLVVSKRLLTIPEIYLHMLLHLNDNFDDDLLMDALEVL